MGVLKACAPRGKAADWVSGSVTQEQHVADLGKQSGGLYAGKSEGEMFLVGGQMDRCLPAVRTRGLD